jgi:hypothetical protein
VSIQWKVILPLTIIGVPLLAIIIIKLYRKLRTIKHGYTKIPDYNQDYDTEMNNSHHGQTVSEYGSGDTEFEKICKIGEGAYGIVDKVRCLTNGKVYAIKKINTQQLNNSMFKHYISIYSKYIFKF